MAKRVNSWDELYAETERVYNKDLRAYGFGGVELDSIADEVTYGLPKESIVKLLSTVDDLDDDIQKDDLLHAVCLAIGSIVEDWAYEMKLNG